MRDLSDFTSSLIRAHRGRGVFTPSDTVPATVEEAYAVHESLIAAIGPTGGFKISGKPGPGRTLAPIPMDRVFESGAGVSVPRTVGVELEVAFLVADILPEAGDPDFEGRLRRAVRPAPAIELVATRLDGPMADRPMAKLADLQANEALICGAPLLDWDGSDFGELDVSLTSNHQTICDGTATVPHGSALSSLAALVWMAGEHCGGLKPGHWVLTGSLHPLTSVPTGQSIEGQVTGLGEVSARLL